MHMNRNNNRSRSSSGISNSNSNNNNKSSNNKSKIFSLKISRGISPHLPGGGRRGRSSTPKSRRRVAAAAVASANNDDGDEDDGSYVSGEHSIEGGIDNKSYNNTSSTARGRFARYLNSKLSYRQSNNHNDDRRDSGRRDIRGQSKNKRAPSLPRQKIGGKLFAKKIKSIW